MLEDGSRSKPSNAEIDGHAIVSADGSISGDEGTMPKALMIAADWALV